MFSVLDITKRLKGEMMTQGEMLKIMADTVADFQNCVLEVMIGQQTAIAHLIPLDEWRAEMEGEEDEED